MRVKTLVDSKATTAALIVAASVAVVFVCPADISAAVTVEDQKIADAVEDALDFDLAVESAGIDVTVTEGIVTLSGSAGNLLQKERASKIARTVKKVRAVVNRIRVVPPILRTDREIESDIEDALRQDPATESWEIEAVVSDHTVSLTGTVDSWQERKLAETVVKSVRGVREVVNNLAIRFDRKRADSEIEAEVARTFHWDRLLDAGLIDIAVEDGRVALSGIVGSAAEKHRAVNKAWVIGVESVNADGLQVQQWARNKDLRENRIVIKSDEQIRNAVKDALFYDARVAGEQVVVQVDQGTVTLRGAVESLRAKRAAGSDARNVIGVLRVKNRLKVTPVEPESDEKIESRVEAALIRDPYVERYEIYADVVAGVAVLSGTVDTYFEKAAAEDAAAAVSGVVSVNNNIEVDDAYDPYVYDPYVDDSFVYGYDWYRYQRGDRLVSDSRIREEIEEELFWSPFVDADQVTVTVENGLVSLSGAVDSWSEYHAATQNALEGGARQVDNNLRVVDD